MKIDKVETEVGQNFNEMMVAASKLVSEGENENVVVLVAKKDGGFHVLTDIETPITITLSMMQGAARLLWDAKRKHVQETQGAPEIVES